MAVHASEYLLCPWHEAQNRLVNHIERYLGVGYWLTVGTRDADRIGYIAAWIRGGLVSIHRDLKSDNIMLTVRGGRQDYVKILDFGLAALTRDPRLAPKGAVFGTPEYMSPEQARGEDATSTSDLYALGILFYEMCTGRLPFRSSDRDTLLEMQRTAPPPPPRALRPDLPELAERIVAAPGDPAYGALSLLVAHFARARIVRAVPPGAFVPPPKVTSAVVAMEVDRAARPRPDLFALVHSGFAHRRKTLKRNLVMAGYEAEAVDAALAGLGLDPRVRAERLGLAEFGALLEVLGPAPRRPGTRAHPD